MNNTQVVLKAISDRTGEDVKDILPSQSLEELGMDSLDFIETVMHLESEYQITIPDEESERFKTVGDVIDYIDGRSPQTKE